MARILEGWSAGLLTGEFKHTMDAKGRVFIPAKWREELKGEVVVTAGQENCLFVMTQNRFAERASQLEQLSPNHKVNRDHNRLFFSFASEEQVDRSGRMNIPQNLREYAGLSGPVVLIGVSGRAEIWDRDVWTEYKQGVEDSYESITEQLDPPRILERIK
ncbi:MAG: division/cell wall cluster transcriptional repressor MraZ [Actinomycetota bacterium]